MIDSLLTKGTPKKGPQSPGNRPDPIRIRALFYERGLLWLISEVTEAAAGKPVRLSV